MYVAQYDESQADVSGPWTPRLLENIQILNNPPVTLIFNS